MHARKFLFRLGVMIAPLAAALALGGPATPAAAATTIVIDDGVTADGCGSYDGDTAHTDLVTAVGGAGDSTTVVICPGTYPAGGGMVITGKNKITIKAALSGEGERPILNAGTSATRILTVTDSTTIVVDGLIMNGKTTSAGTFIGLALDTSSATVKNTVILGPNAGGTLGMRATANPSPKVLSLSISNSYIAGYSTDGLQVNGAYKVTVTNCQFDGTDGGRVPSGGSQGIFIRTSAGGIYQATGSVTGSRILNNDNGITINGASKVKLSGNILTNNKFGIRVNALPGGLNVDSLSITNNTIMGITDYGILMDNQDVATVSIKKLSISKNVITAAQFGSVAVGFRITTDAVPGSAVSGKLSSNTFMAFDSGKHIDLGATNLTASGNIYMP